MKDFIIMNKTILILISLIALACMYGLYKKSTQGSSQTPTTDIAESHSTTLTDDFFDSPSPHIEGSSNETSGSSFSPMAIWQGRKSSKVASDDPNQMTDTEKREFNRDQMRKSFETVMHTLMLDRYDLDGDGEISEAEREKMRENMQARGEQMRKEAIEFYDTDGDGELTREEQRVMRNDMMTTMRNMSEKNLRQFDKNKDGILSDEEVQTMQEAQIKLYKEKDMFEHMREEMKVTRNRRKAGEIGL